MVAVSMLAVTAYVGAVIGIVVFLIVVTEFFLSAMEKR